MICRVWRGWTTPENAEAYQALLTGQIMPGFRAKGLPGFKTHQAAARQITGPDGTIEIEHMTLIWFANIDDIKRFAGADETVANVPQAAREVLKRWDSHAAHYDLFDDPDDITRRSL